MQIDVVKTLNNMTHSQLLIFSIPVYLKTSHIKDTYKCIMTEKVVKYRRYSTASLYIPTLLSYFTTQTEGSHFILMLPNAL